jgi:chromate transporter
VAGLFLRLGAVGYGGPAVMGLMQAEGQEKRQWLSKERFLDRLALANMLPGPGAAQLGIYLARCRPDSGEASWRGSASCSRRS